MKTIVATVLFFICCIFSFYPTAAQKPAQYVLVIHGGAGNMTPAGLGAEKEKQYTAKLTEALRIGDSVLKNNGTSLDAVVAVITFMEDCPLFNAGKGAVFNDDGKNELDASIMEGKTLKAGAVAGVTTIKNPIKAARRVMDSSRHVMLTGCGAEKFAQEQHFEIVDPSYFFDQERWDQYLNNKKKPDQRINIDKKGTVGAVALDQFGNLAAGTSTGGLSNKKWGRVGDSPIIGAGTYANNQTCAVSCTGTGEYFIRLCVAHNISAKMEYGGQNLEKAAATAIQEVSNLGGDGGLIAVDKEGNIAMPFNTAGMFRGYAKSNGELKVNIYK